MVSSTGFVCGSLVLLAIFRALQCMSRRRKEITLPILRNEEPGIEIPPLLDFDVASTPPRSYRPWSSGKFSMTMGIQKVPHEDWLMIDNRYGAEQALRRELLAHHRHGVMQSLPSSETACEETLETVVSFLTRRYPKLFFRPVAKPDYVHNALTNRTFKVTKPYKMPPLEVAAQLAMEDLNLLVQGYGDDPEQHYLVASFSMAPAGWYLQERIGWPLYKIHGPVPMWEDKLRKSVEKYFLKMKSDEPISRHNFFLQTNETMFQQEPFASELSEPPKVENIRIRHERQTLRRLPRSRAILFTVRTYLTPLTELEDEPESVKQLLESIRALPPDMAKYKARHIWGEVVEEWCERIIGTHQQMSCPKN